MAYTTKAKIEALMQESFNSTSTPTDSEITQVYISWADKEVNNEDISGVDSVDKEMLSTLAAAHMISLSRNVEFRNADVTIKETPATFYSQMYNRWVAKTRESLFAMAND